MSVYSIRSGWTSAVRQDEPREVREHPVMLQRLENNPQELARERDDHSANAARRGDAPSPARAVAPAFPGGPSKDPRGQEQAANAG